MEPVVDYGMGPTSFEAKYGHLEELPRSTADEIRVHAIEVLMHLAPDIVSESDPIPLNFDGVDLFVSYVTTPEGDLVITKDPEGYVKTLTYVEEPFTGEFVYQLVVDGVCAAFSEEMI